MPAASLLQTGKTRIGRSCPPSCLLHWGSLQLLRQMLGLYGREERSKFEANGVLSHQNEAGTSSMKKMEYILYAVSFFLLRFMTVPVTGPLEMPLQLFLGNLGFSSALLSVLLLGM